ncbi:MAG: VCBS repeat-containing protein, partial [Flavobacteriales bacterium]|nr:VCBS repeat-containing protein [Flavobacteriales bacterium]
MRHHYLFLALCGSPLYAQQDCASAIPIDAGVHSVAAIMGEIPDAPRCTTVDDGPAAHAIWYSYTVTADTIVEITTSVFGQPQVDTRFHVYHGDCADLTCVVGNDNGGLNGTSRASFDAQMGETYYIVFDDRWSSDAFSFELKTIYYSAGNTESYASFVASFINLQGQPRAVVDMDNDGLDDVVGVTQTLVNIHYQQVDGGLMSVAIPTDFADFPASWSLCAGDLDRNGFKDLLYGGGYGVTFMFATPDGNGFIERSGPEYVFSQRSNMVDINNDGHLDAFVCHDVAPNVLFLNDGLGNLQFYQGGLGMSCGNYGSIWVDYDNDGRLDLYLLADGAANRLLHNLAGGFSNVANVLANDAGRARSAAWADYSNDGRADLLLVNADGATRLLRQVGAGSFVAVTPGALYGTAPGRSGIWGDYDNDGDLDVFLSRCGARDQLLRNDGSDRFVDVGEPGLAASDSSTGAAWADFDNDGDLDLAVADRSGTVRLYRNNLSAGHAWLRVRPRAYGGGGATT